MICMMLGFICSCPAISFSRQSQSHHAQLNEPSHTSSHSILPILTNPYTLTRLLKLEVLHKLNSVLELGIILQALFPLANKPVGEGAGGVGARDGIDGDAVLGGDFHLERGCTTAWGMGTASRWSMVLGMAIEVVWAV